MKTTFHPCRSENVGRGECLLIAGEYIWLSFPFQNFITDLEGFAKDSYKSLLIPPAGDGGKRVGLKRTKKYQYPVIGSNRGSPPFIERNIALSFQKKRSSFPWFCFSWRKEMPIPTIEQCIVAFPKDKSYISWDFLESFFRVSKFEFQIFWIGQLEVQVNI